MKSFWGLKLEPGVQYTKTVDQAFHISSATLDISSPPNNIVSVIFNDGNEDFTLCNLSKKDSIFQVPLDLQFVEGEQISFKIGGGNGKVHLTGYNVFIEEEDEDSLVDEAVEAMELDIPKLNKKRKLPKEKELVPSAEKKKPRHEQNGTASPTKKQQSPQSKKKEKQQAKNNNKNERLTAADLFKQELSESDEEDDDYEMDETEEFDDTLGDEDDMDDDLTDEGEESDDEDSDADMENIFQNKKNRGNLTNSSKSTEDNDMSDDEDDEDDEDDDEDEEEEEEEDSDEISTPVSKKANVSLNNSQNKNNQKKFDKKAAAEDLNSSLSKNAKKQDKKGAQTPKSEQKKKQSEFTPKDKKNKDAQTPKQGQTPKVIKPGGVVCQDLHVGSGQEAKMGKMVSVYYEGRLKTGKVFDKQLSGPHFNFRLGSNEVIKAWDIGVVGMKVGGKRRLTAPPNAAYGKQGAPPDIPPNSTLMFDIELKAIK